MSHELPLDADPEALAEVGKLIKQCENNLLISYPRSGSHWVRYFIEACSGRPTDGEKLNRFDTSVFEQLGLKKKDGEPIIARTHVPTVEDAEKRIICLVRNPLEVITKHKDRNLQREMESYRTILDVYDLAKERLFIYYEDLIVCPALTLAKIAEFLNFSCDGFDFDYHRNRCFNLYSALGETETDGKTAIYYSKNQSKEFLNKRKIDHPLLKRYYETTY